ncbi:MAG: EF-hand domain-containing protein [Alphaproteobacteria bacterium]|nr:EF-hand domain-containing protein [Alphaproteobacteria bacterium]MBU0793925.1 EF-hand domain-containing protein [Alphaproteobacteria bacterium]MBU0875829.1 EF-hand domain-containing protein [Alphaproteobacteria bacterium]MBU1769991.1 EF-hand domain-containing protein [Alphaproteobacteria bacterium]
MKLKRFPSLAFATVAGLCTLAFPAQAQGQRDPVQMLERADLNGDGRITREEHRQARAQMFDRLDRDGNGTVTQSDAPGGLFRRSAGERFASIIKRLDGNGDGRLTREEFMNAPAPGFDRADSNGDNVIDRAELAAARNAVAARRE